jgi:RNA polymerase sigma-70 factor (ECF subfamily)
MKKFSQFTPDEDSPLLLSWHRGDFSAFETLIWKYQKRVFNLALLLTGAEKAACEVVENSFTSAYQNIRSLKSTARFSSWLIGLALKECRELNNYRSEEPDSPAEPELDLEDESSYAAALHKKLELCIRALPSELSEVILLRYVRGFSLDRVEEILQISGDMVLTRLFEAQETLACWLRSDTDDPAELAAMRKTVSSIHPEIRRNFSAYLDNTAEGDEKELTKAHLKSCGSCREALAELEWMVEDIKGIPDIEPPHWLAPSIMQKVKSTPAKPVEVKTPANLKIQIAVAVLFIAVIGIFYFLFQGRSEPEQELPSSENQAVPPPPSTQKVAPSGNKFPAMPQGVLRSAPTPAENLPGAYKSVGPPSFPLPTELPPERTLQPTPSLKPVQPLADTKSDQLQKGEKPAAMQPGLQEWGDPLPQGSSLDQK